MLKACLFKYLSDPERTSPPIQYQSRESKPFVLISKVVLKYLNLFLQETEGCTLRNGLRIDFSKGEYGGRFSRLFTKNGAVDVSEAGDHNATDQLFPFSGEIVDPSCGNSTSTPRTEVCIAYVDLVRKILRRFKSAVHTEVELMELHRQINYFKCVARAVFAPFQGFCIGTSK